MSPINQNLIDNKSHRLRAIRFSCGRSLTNLYLMSFVLISIKGFFENAFTLLRKPFDAGDGGGGGGGADGGA